MGRTSDAADRLRQAAIDLMWEESYGAVTIDDICHRADVKKGSFYYFFKSKADLMVSALEHLWKDSWKPNLDQSFSSSIDPLDRFIIYLGKVHDLQAEARVKYGKMLGCPVCSVGSEVSTQEADVAGTIRDIMSRKRRYFETAIRDALAAGVIEPCDPAEKAVAFMGLIEGLIAQARIMDDPGMLRQLPEMALNLLRAKVTPALVAKA
jgi:TetR/AcrR family transcriptional repressor of nem operon